MPHAFGAVGGSAAVAAASTPAVVRGPANVIRRTTVALCAALLDPSLPGAIPASLAWAASASGPTAFVAPPRGTALAVPAAARTMG